MSEKIVKNKAMKIVSIVLLAVFIISLVPMLYIGKYAFPSEDDFSYGRSGKETFEETGSFFATVGTAFGNARDSYFSWQGTFSGIVVMSLGPYIYNLDYYALTPYILIFMMLFSTFFFTYKVFLKKFGLSVWEWIIVAVMLLFAQMQYMQYPNSSFYWYNGSSLYMTFYCSALVVYGLLIDLIMSESKKGLWLYAAIVPLATFTATGNFVISLNFAIINAFIVLLMVLFKNKGWKKALPVLLIAVAGLLIITLAPGNSARIEKQNADSSAISAVIKSFSTAFLYVFKPGHLTVGKYFGAIIILFSLPVAAKAVKNIKYDFRYPAAAVILAFCIFASVMTPTLWGLGRANLPRVNNIIYFYYIWMILFDCVYLIGWVYNKLNIKTSMPALEPKPAKKIFIGIYYSGLVCALVVMLMGIDVHDPEQQPTTLRAAQVIRYGTGRVFAAENARRVEILESEGKDAVLKAYSNKPDLLYFNDMYEDPDEWFNRVVAAYFGKDSVVVDK